MACNLNLIGNLLLNLLFPVTCCICNQENKEQKYLCHNCFKKLKFGAPQFNLKLNFVDELAIAGNYDDGLLGELIKKLKFNSIEPLGPILADFLTIFWQGRASLMNVNNLLVIPIPLSPQRERRRGFNQTEIIAKHFAKNFNYKLNLELKKIKHTKQQSGLSEKRRQKNITAVFFWQGEPLINKQIILIDDVITTGATINEAAKILKLAGAKKIIALALAKG